MGARFSASLSAAAPFQIQLTAPSGRRISLLQVLISGDNSSGSASWPVISRPSTPGSGTGTGLPLDGTGSPASTVVTSFAVSPSTPTAPTGSFNLPYTHRKTFAPGMVVVEGGESILVYAAASGGQTLSGSIIWEEH